MCLSATIWRKKGGVRAHCVVPRIGGAHWLGPIADQICMWHTRDGRSVRDDVCALRDFASSLQDVQTEIRDPPAR
jgi:hypothetical protein